MEGRAASNVIQLPLWYEHERGTPNSFLRSALFAAIESKDRKFLKEAALARSKDISVKYTGEQLNQEDLTVWDALVHLARRHPLGNICQFTAHGLLKSLGLHTGGAEHRRLHTTITRMIASAIEIKHDGQTYIGSLIEDAGAIDEEPTKRYALRLNPNLIRHCGETRWTALNGSNAASCDANPLRKHCMPTTALIHAPCPSSSLRCAIIPVAATRNWPISSARSVTPSTNLQGENVGFLRDLRAIL